MVIDPAVQKIDGDLTEELAKGITQAVKDDTGVNAKEEAILALHYKELIETKKQSRNKRSYKIPTVV